MKAFRIALLLLPFACPLSYGTIAVVGTPPAITGNVGTTITSPSYNTTGANLIVIHATCYNVLATAANLTDNMSNGNPTAIGAGIRPGVSDSRLFYYSNPTVGSGHTFTLACTAPAIAVIAFSGAATSSVLDQNTGTGNTSSTSVATGSITPGVNGEVVVVGGNAADLNTGTITANSGVTQVAAPLGYVGGTHISNWMYYIIQTTAAAINVTVSDTNTNNSRSGTIASFKPGATATFQPHAPQIVDLMLGSRSSAKEGSR